MERIAGIALPDTPLAREAESMAKGSLPAEIFNHSLRTFLFAELVAEASKIDHDAELLFVSAILHDTGLSAQHMSERNRFEIDGANLARELLQRHGDATRGEIAWDAIALHDSSFARWKGPEVRLVSEGVNVDFGAHLDTLNHDRIRAVLRAAPRTNFIPSFLDHVAALVKKKPFATGVCFVTDVAYRLVPGFHVDNFVDAVRADDPFASL